MWASYEEEIGNEGEKRHIQWEVGNGTQKTGGGTES